MPQANGRFSKSNLPDDPEYEFTPILGRDVMLEHAPDGTRTLLGERYIPSAIPGRWAARAGHYEIANLDPDDASRSVPAAFALVALSMDLKIQDGVLLLEGPQLSYTARFVIAPLSDTLGYFRGLERNLGGSVQIVDVDGTEHIQFLNRRYRRTV